MLLTKQLFFWLVVTPLSLLTKWIIKDLCSECGETLRYTGYDHIFRCDKCEKEEAR